MPSLSHPHSALTLTKPGPLSPLLPRCSPESPSKRRHPDHVCRVRSERALQAEHAGSAFGQSSLFFLSLVGRVTCGWLVLRLTLACPCVLHRQAATLCSSLTPTGLLSPPAAGVRFVTVGSILRNGKENISAQLELEGVNSSSAGTAASLSCVHSSEELLALDY